MTSFDQREQRWRQATKLLAALLAVVFGAGALWFTPTPFRTGDRDPTQEEYLAEIEADRRKLIVGVVVTERTVTTDVGEYVDVFVRICGLASARCDLALDPMPPQLSDVSETSAKIGGRVAIDLRSAMSGDIKPLSSSEQPVIDAGDDAEWHWSVRPDEVGSFHLAVSIRVLKASTDTALLPDETISITLQSDRTFSYIIKQIWSATMSVAGLVTALGATVTGGVIWLLRRGRRSKDSVVDDTPTADTTYL